MRPQHVVSVSGALAFCGPLCTASSMHTRPYGRLPLETIQWELHTVHTMLYPTRHVIPQEQTQLGSAPGAVVEHKHNSHVVLKAKGPCNGIQSGQLVAPRSNPLTQTTHSS